MSNQKSNKKYNNPKPVYKKKPKPQKPIITNEVAQKKKYVQEINLVEPTEKYKSIIEAVKKKGFFVDAKFGFRINFENIKEFHVDTKKDIPVVLTMVSKPNKQSGGTTVLRNVYRIIRYNDDEIIGIHSNNINIWQMKTVKV